eukprot:NODE_5480_length_703_cov_2.379205_g4621_i0.p1 GENE.NODE_5480_length_703_cov_2.379205_g4621_i0~~NODE_5480_length_703_cov_2.379205_g4621_i0.p1  ORF type:complete len:174 (-),score=63.23 NODE_5480_length_703_cov_2.379205_g4621_i0:180-641(-)
MGGVYSVLSNRRGVILSDDTVGGVSSLHAIRAHLPVAESLGLAESLRASTAGRATPQCVFSHWQRVPGEALEEGSLANGVVLKIRERKGLKGPIPPMDSFVDRVDMKDLRPFVADMDVAPNPINATHGSGGKMTAEELTKMKAEDDAEEASHK